MSRFYYLESAISADPSVPMQMSPLQGAGTTLPSISTQAFGSTRRLSQESLRLAPMRQPHVGSLSTQSQNLGQQTQQTEIGYAPFTTSQLQQSLGLWATSSFSASTQMQSVPMPNTQDFVSQVSSIPPPPPISQWPARTDNGDVRPAAAAPRPAWELPPDQWARASREQQQQQQQRQ